MLWKHPEQDRDGRFHHFWSSKSNEERKKTKRLKQTKLFLFVVYAENPKESTKTYN